MADIDDKALDSMSVAPENPEADVRNAGDAGGDKSIDKRLQKNPESVDARLDNGLDESMDASDPISATQPRHSTEPAPSSGYDAKAEAKRQGQ